MQYEPTCDSVGSILFVPAFAEEMNKARRMISQQARQFTQIGFQVIVPDLYGTGDSDGAFARATVEVWCSDLINLLCSDERKMASPLWIWGHRFGALLAIEVAKLSPRELAGAILWSPCCDGKRYIDQFMRIKSMSSLVSGSTRTESIADIRNSLSQDKKVEIAGYEITAELVSSIDQMAIDTISRTKIPIVHWFELNSSAERPASPAVQRRVSALAESGVNVELHLVEGPDFWATPEHSEASRLLDATSRALA